MIAAPRTTFTPKPKAPAPVRPKTGPYAKDAKFLDEVRELLLADRAIYQEQATSLRAEADSLALEREPGDVQFDEESGEGGTVTVDRERNLALSGQASLAVEEIDDALEAHRRQDLRVLRALLPADSQAAPAGAAVCPALRGVQERRAVAALTRFGVLAFAIAVIVVVADRVTTSLAVGPPPRRAPRLGPVRPGTHLQLRVRLQPLQRAGASRDGAAVHRRRGAGLRRGAGPHRARLAVGSGLVLGGAIGNLSERIVGGPGGRVPDFITLDYWPTFNLADACVTVGVIIVIVALLFGDRSPAQPKVEEAG